MGQSHQSGELSVCEFAPVRFFFILPECFIMAGSINGLRQAVSKWETGITIPDLEVLLKISKLYNIS